MVNVINIFMSFDVKLAILISCDITNGFPSIDLCHPFFVFEMHDE